MLENENSSNEENIRTDGTQNQESAGTDTSGRNVNNDAGETAGSGQGNYSGQSTDASGQGYYSGQSTDTSGQDYYSGQRVNYTGTGRAYYQQADENAGSDSGMPPKKKKNGKKIAALIAGVVVAAALIAVGVKLVTDHVADNAGRAISDAGSGNEQSTAGENKEYPAIGSTSDGETEASAEENTDAAGGTVSDTAPQTQGEVLITDVSKVVKDVMPSIVAITSTTVVESDRYGYDWFWGNGYGYGDNDQNQYEEVGAGSGIIVKQTDSELLIVTNNHVVQGADSLSIQFDNGKSIKGVTKSTDEEADIAIVSIPLSDIDKDTIEAIKIATLGNSDNLSVGEGVIAIGNALGYGQSVTTGVISAKDRDIAIDNKTMTVLQTDAAINGGNSGGALLNSKGEVIGINVAKYSSSSYSGSASIEGMGFAIPISQANDIINNLMDKQTRTKVDEKDRGYLGITVVDADATTAQMFSIPQGIFVREVTKGGAADKAGIRATDVIIKFDGQSVTTKESLISKLEYYKKGEKVMLTIERNENGSYKEREVEVELGESSDTGESATSAQDVLPNLR